MRSPNLTGVRHALEPTLNQYRYFAVAGLVLLEDFGPPTTPTPKINGRSFQSHLTKTRSLGLRSRWTSS